MRIRGKRETYLVQELVRCHEELELEGIGNQERVRQQHQDELDLEGNAKCISS